MVEDERTCSSRSPARFPFPFVWGRALPAQRWIETSQEAARHRVSGWAATLAFHNMNGSLTNRRESLSGARVLDEEGMVYQEQYFWAVRD